MYNLNILITQNLHRHNAEKLNVRHFKILIYEKYIKNIYYYLKKYYNIPEIEWIIENKDI